MLRSLLGVLVLGALSVGCEAAATSPAPSASAAREAAASNQAKSTAGAQQSPAQQKNRSFGEPITVKDETALIDIAREPSRFTDQTVRTTGTVQAVCQMAGCWMEIGDADSRAHIKMKGHSFYVPKDCAGKKAVVQAVVMSGEPQPTCGDHDSCGGPENGATAKIELVATGVELVD
ncbi:MAG: DUF4920 domain-containing protein [Polyangiaceae bacterium]